jgi:hypothetical protein
MFYFLTIVFGGRPLLCPLLLVWFDLLWKVSLLNSGTRVGRAYSPNLGSGGWEQLKIQNPPLLMQKTHGATCSVGTVGAGRQRPFC